MSRVKDMPVYEHQHVEVTARLYNLWRRAKLHYKFPIRFSLTGYQGLVMMINESEWLCADESLNDFPVICWLNFDDHGRDALHKPVQCTQNYYHFAANKIQAHVLELMDCELEKILH